MFHPLETLLDNTNGVHAGFGIKAFDKIVKHFFLVILIEQLNSRSTRSGKNGEQHADGHGGQRPDLYVLVEVAVVGFVDEALQPQIT